jgi:hypothetical protein
MNPTIMAVTLPEVVPLIATWMVPATNCSQKNDQYLSMKISKWENHSPARWTSQGRNSATLSRWLEMGGVRRIQWAVKIEKKARISFAFAGWITWMIEISPDWQEWRNIVSLLESFQSAPRISKIPIPFELHEDGIKLTPGPYNWPENRLQVLTSLNKLRW